MKCEFFVVPGNGQVLLDMPDKWALKIIDINIDSLEAEDIWKGTCNTNTDATKVSNAKQEIHGAGKGCTNMDGIFKANKNNSGSAINPNANTLTKCFLLCPNFETHIRKSAELIQQMHTEFDNIFNGIWCFKGTFSLQLKHDSRPYQAPPRHVAYVLQKPFKDELDQLQQMDVITPLGVIAEWCNSFVLVPKANGKVRLC